MYVLEYSPQQKCFHIHLSLRDCAKTNYDNIIKGSAPDFLPIAFFQERDHFYIDKFKVVFLRSIEEAKLARKKLKEKEKKKAEAAKMKGVKKKSSKRKE